MKIRSISSFKYNFRSPGTQVGGTIRFAIGQTVLGKILIGRSQIGICAIFLGDDEESLLTQLSTEFPGIDLEHDQATLQRELNQVIGFVDKDDSQGVVNLDIGGAEFEQRVWQALCGIPTGRTRSYGEVARDIGVPEAVRAVASACAANVLAIAIPCHRVVRSDGSISGYRWGVERKRALLVEEEVAEFSV